MASNSNYRRARGTPTTQLHMFVEPDVYEKIVAYAQRANCPQWAIVEAAIRAGIPGPNGIPTNWDIPGPDGEPLPGLEVSGGDAVRKTA